MGLELGSWREANEELEKLPPTLRARREVFALRCQIYEKAERWNDLRVIAEGCFDRRAEDGDFLAHMAWADHKMNNTFGAHLLMLGYSGLYGGSAFYLYRLACLSAVLGRIDEARGWLAKAFEKARYPQKMKLQALDQPELEKLWGEIQEC